MIATVFSAGIYGIEGYLVTVECGLVNGLPSFELVGLPGAAGPGCRNHQYTKTDIPQR